MNHKLLSQFVCQELNECEICAGGEMTIFIPPLILKSSPHLYDSGDCMKIFVEIEMDDEAFKLLIEVGLDESDSDFSRPERVFIGKGYRGQEVRHIHNLTLNSNLSGRAVADLLTATSLHSELITMPRGEAASISAHHFLAVPYDTFLYRFTRRKLSLNFG